MHEKRNLIEPGHPDLSIGEQCKLLGLSRSSFYYERIPASELNLALMEAIDRLYLKHPFFGSRKMATVLGSQGYQVNRKRTQRLMRLMGIEAIYCKPRTTTSHPAHKKYPYLLRNIPIYRPNQVWAADITYVRVQGGFLYLVAIIDWFSRYVLTWNLSNSLESSFCVTALKEALHRYEWPEIFNTDQGVQFTDEQFTQTLSNTGKIQISMDGKGRCIDNIFVERLWRSFKYEDMYIKVYINGIDAHANIKAYMRFFNEQRPHQSLSYKTPQQVYSM